MKQFWGFVSQFIKKRKRAKVTHDIIRDPVNVLKKLENGHVFATGNGTLMFKGDTVRMFDMSERKQLLFTVVSVSYVKGSKKWRAYMSPLKLSMTLA